MIQVQPNTIKSEGLLAGSQSKCQAVEDALPIYERFILGFANSELI